MKILYFDYAATTPIAPQVAEIMQSSLADKRLFANAASMHLLGREAKTAIENARAQVASAINADSDEIIWTSGATEADNLAIKGAAALYQRKGNHIVTMRTEHKAVLDTCQHLEKQGYRVTYLKPLANGLLNLNALHDVLSDNTILVSIMHVNNETGVIQNIQQIAQLTASRNILLHVDAAQSIGKVIIDVKATPIDLLSLSAHKCYGPKGIGALYVRKKPRVRVEPLIHGGGHEHGMRSGTLATHQIIGMGKAFELIERPYLIKETEAITEKRNHFLTLFKSLVPSIKLNVDIENTPLVPHISNIRFATSIADVLLAKCPQVAASTASACQGNSIEGSYVLRAMGLTQDEIQRSVRFSLGRFTTLQEITQCVQSLVSHV